MVTMPRPPSTRMRWPSLMRDVAVPVPTTAGRPYSRATMAAWLIEPPMSDTAAAIFWKIGAQVGLVTWQTRMSPCLQPRDLLHRLHHARRAFDHAARSGEALDLVACRRVAGREPGIEALARDAPQHDDGRVVDDVGHRARAPAAFRVFAHSAMAARRCATIAGQCGGPRGGEPVDQDCHQVDDRGLELVVREVEDIVFASAKNPCCASSAPNSRILLKNRFVYQCSQ